MNERMAKATPSHPTLQRLDASLLLSPSAPPAPLTLSLPTTLCFLPLLLPLCSVLHIQLSSEKVCLLTVCVFQDF